MWDGPDLAVRQAALELFQSTLNARVADDTFGLLADRVLRWVGRHADSIGQHEG